MKVTLSELKQDSEASPSLRATNSGSSKVKETPYIPPKGAKQQSSDNHGSNRGSQGRY